VLVIEIAGARALAPYYGSSLRSGLPDHGHPALSGPGYGAGGRISRLKGDWKLGLAFWGAGLWLVLYPFMRNAVLSGTAAQAGVAWARF